MILQALKEYYDRKPDLPRLGFEEKEIPFIIVLDASGKPVGINSTYEGSGRARRAKKYLVPQAVKKTSGIASNLLWENPEYALGIVIKGKPERIAEQHVAFKKRIESLGELNDTGLSAVKSFLAEPDKASVLKHFGESWLQLLDESANLTFQLAGDTGLVLESQKVKTAVISSLALGTEEQAICLVTGKRENIERLHSAVKGVWGAQTSGANIVSFNLDSFKSFGKDQGANSPVGKTTAFEYITALNHLLCKDSRQRMQVADTSTVFWSSKATTFEQEISDFFSEPPKDDPDRNTRAVESLFKSVQTGATPSEEDKTRFYVLGLAPNASRISIRFWIVDTVTGMSQKICQHFQDIRIAHGPKDHASLSLFRLLSATAAQGKADNIPPNLAGDTMRTILEGLPYPETLLQSAVRRNRAEHSVSYPRAALIKACINRKTRFKDSNTKEEFKMSLDKENKNVGYRLGRLFAVLVKNQEDANNTTTIRDSYYGSASSTPAVAFGTLMRLSKHHLSKIQKEKTGLYVIREKLIGEIMNGISDFPAHMPIDDQGRFAIGYYHQTQDFYTIKENK